MPVLVWASGSGVSFPDTLHRHWSSQKDPPQVLCQHTGVSRGKRPGTSLNMLRTAPIAENDLAWLSAVLRGRLTTNWGGRTPY